MDVSKYRSYRDVYQNRVRFLEQQIVQAKVTNQMREKLICKKTKHDALLRDINTYLGKLQIIYSRSIKENDDFRTRRLNLLSAAISDGLERVFPNDDLIVKVLCNFKRKNMVKLQLIKKDGEVYNPYISSGKLQQYLISFCAVSCIIKALGVKCLYVDEAFGASSMKNLPIIGEFMKELCETDGMQMVVVSQNPELYHDISHREIKLRLVGEDHAIVEAIDDIQC